MDRRVAHQLHSKTVRSPVCNADCNGEGGLDRFRPMVKEYTTRFAALLLALITLTAICFAWINFFKEREYQLPYDGVWWVSANGQAKAEKVAWEGPGARAGVRAGDVLVSIDGRTVTTNVGVTRALYHAGVWTKAKYRLSRQGFTVDSEVILTPLDRSMNVGLRFIALTYLGIGLYVLLRRWTAPRSAHFYLFCLVSFIYYGFHYTGKLNGFDEIVYWANVVAELLQPALFLHFVLEFPQRKELLEKRGWVGRRDLHAGGVDSGNAHRRLEMGSGQRDAALESGPDFHAARSGADGAGGRGPLAYLQARGHAGSPPADEVGDARYGPGHCALDDLRGHLPARRPAGRRGASCPCSRWCCCR